MIAAFPAKLNTNFFHGLVFGACNLYFPKIERRKKIIF